MKLRIIADENIPFAREAFGPLGEVTLFKGRERPPVENTDALIVRSVTKVNQDLLDGSPVRFVGTATIGMDHIDTAYLHESGIGFASAPGSNAESVAEYVTAALLVHARDNGIELTGKSIAVIGVGNVGSRVVKKCQALGMTVLKNDPPLAEQTGDPSFLLLDDVIGADFVTFHVPLIRDGRWPTWHMAGPDLLAAMNGVLINTSRGSVVDGDALEKALGKTVSAAILDVWENEPHVSRNLADMVRGTPHIAGYSFDGKVNGTRMMHDALCGHFGIDHRWEPSSVMPPGPHVVMRGETVEESVRDAVLQVYDIEEDYRTFLRRFDEFDLQRKEYPRRREFHTAHIMCAGSREALPVLIDLGFKPFTEHV